MVDMQCGDLDLAPMRPSAASPTSSLATLREDDDFSFKQEDDASSFYDSASNSPFLFASSASSAVSPMAISATMAMSSACASAEQSPVQAQTSMLSAADMDDDLFSSYVGSGTTTATTSVGDGAAVLPPSGGSAAWDFYYAASSGAPLGFPASAVSSGMPPINSRPAASPTVGMNGGRSGPHAAMASRSGLMLTPVTTPTGMPRQSGVKRAFDRMTSTDGSMASTPSASPKGSPTAAVATSMLAMRNVADEAKSGGKQALMMHARAMKGGNTVNIGRKLPAGVKKETEDSDATTPTASKKTKVSRERQLKINAASRRCRKKQKLELQFLRTHVVELQAALKDQVNHLRGQLSQQQRAARLSHFVDESLRKVDEMSSGVRPSPASTPVAPSASFVTFGADLLAFKTAEDHSGEDTDGTHSNDAVNHIETDDASSIHTIDPATGYSLSDERKRELLNIAAFVRVNITLESGSFSPEVISCLPIEMDGWQLRLAITEKNYTIHNSKFFPCDLKDMYDFCWETNVAQKISIKHGKKHYVVVTPLDPDVAHVYSKTTGKWSLSVHGVPNVSYNSLVCRRYIADQKRAIICQQSVLEERDFQDENTIPWLFKRWVVFRPLVQDGVEGTFVEAYRTASYATGRLIYKEDNTYDSFCEHLIRRYAESNSLLERMMARDKRFEHAFDASVRAEASAEPTVSDRMIKDLLLF
ncbi:hypothetical protein BBJ28_00018971 [Nothophytophthora sp. Chile5]|nr:hypothetical protein BBJ28_00018971 [Nothophytophthora sp. Chile5]